MKLIQYEKAMKLIICVQLTGFLVYIIKETHSSAFVARLRLGMDLKFRDFLQGGWKLVNFIYYEEIFSIYALDFL